MTILISSFPFWLMNCKRDQEFVERQFLQADSQELILDILSKDAFEREVPDWQKELAHD